MISLSNRLNLDGGISPSTTVIPEGVSFDGSTDYLSRSTDLVGNIDSKTFTFSCWVYWDGLSQTRLYDSYDIATNYYGLRVYVTTSGQIQMYGYSLNGTLRYRHSSSAVVIKKDTWANILISLDLSDSLKHKWYVNDIDVTPTPDIYSNVDIDFTKPYSTIANTANSTSYKLKGRLAHLFLAYEYIDLSIESNRGIFITSDGLPA